MVLKSDKKDFSYTLRVLRRTSVYVANYLNRFGVTPNQVSIFRFFVFGLAGAYCFFIGTHIANIIGLTLLFLSFYFDLVDGDLARNHNKKTKLGGVLEDMLDPLLLNIVILAIITNLFYENNEFRYFGIALLFGLFFSLKITLFFKYAYSVDCVESSEKVDKFFEEEHVDFISFVAEEMIVPKRFWMSLFSNFRTYLIAGAVFNILPLTFALYTVMINIRWVFLTITIILLNTDRFKNLTLARALSIVRKSF